MKAGVAGLVSSCDATVKASYRGSRAKWGLDVEDREDAEGDERRSDEQGEDDRPRQRQPDAGRFEEAHCLPLVTGPASLLFVSLLLFYALEVSGLHRAFGVAKLVSGKFLGKRGDRVPGLFELPSALVE